MRVPNLDLTSEYASLMLDMMFCDGVCSWWHGRGRNYSSDGWHARGNVLLVAQNQKDLLTTVRRLQAMELS